MACGRGPTRDKLPLNTTLNSCGSSSRLVLRMKRPTRGTRGSFLVKLDCLIEQAVFELAVDGVRSRTDQGQIALEHDVEQLRQLVEAGLADEAADAGDARIVLGDDLQGVGVARLDIERAELEHLDQLVVE